MIVDRTEDWIRAGMPTTPERVAWAKAYRVAESLAALTANFIPSDPQPERKPLTLSSHIYCPRQLWFKVQGKVTQDRAPRVLNNWDMGRAAESSGVARCILNPKIPVLSPVWGTNQQRRVGIDLGGDEAYRGSLDLAVAADPNVKIDSLEAQDAYWNAKLPVILVDYKSRTTMSFRSDVDGRGVGNDFGYEDQLGLYGAACEAEGRAVAEMLFALVRKETGHEAEVACPKRDDLVAEARAAFAAANGSVLPERPDWAIVKVVKAPGGAVEQIESKRCGYCDGREACWPGYEQKMVSGQVVYRKLI